MGVGPPTMVFANSAVLFSSFATPRSPILMPSSARKRLEVFRSLRRNGKAAVRHHLKKPQIRLLSPVKDLERVEVSEAVDRLAEVLPHLWGGDSTTVCEYSSWVQPVHSPHLRLWKQCTATPLEQLPEVTTGTALHHNVEFPYLDEGIQIAHDARMVDGREQPHLVQRILLLLG